MKKLQLFLITFVLLTASLLAGCLPQKGAQETTPSAKSEATIPSNWQTYKNAQHGFSFQYPTDWDFNPAVDREDFFSGFLRKEDATQEKVNVYGEEMVPFYEVNIVVEANEENLSARDFYLNQFSASSRQEAAEKIEEVTVGGVSGIKYSEGATPASGASTAVMVTKNQKVYNFIYSAMAHQGTHEKYLDVFKLLLSSVSLKL